MVSLDPMVPGVAYMIGLLQTDGSHEGSIDAKGRVSLELAIRDERILERIAETCRVIRQSTTALAQPTLLTIIKLPHYVSTIRGFGGR
ncbi:hypothetical protein [Nocardia cyriacigeorgica]|uniref:hypothetical protein n=1 Tax=Nocardia cyriacigeorgica TaxID=135487 RepID=UPI001894E18B|nr:hypothetical protein [Nocardia cyriacigeorgica]MBF6415171.1 hypothetical protein [Nocardia cyriacigeorgica]